MHEYGIVSNLIRVALDRLAQEAVSEVVYVEFEFGEFLFVDPENATMAYESLTRGTILENSELRIRVLPGKIQCLSCGYVGKAELPDKDHLHFSDHLLVCPNCSASPRIIQGLECSITQMEVIVA